MYVGNFFCRCGSMAVVDLFPHILTKLRLSRSRVPHVFFLVNTYVHFSRDVRTKYNSEVISREVRTKYKSEVFSREVRTKYKSEVLSREVRTKYKSEVFCAPSRR